VMSCFLEFILPKLKQIVERKADDLKKAKKHDITKDDYTPLTDESKLDEYEEFDDFLEMVITLGYITLFASAYPFAAVVAFGSNIIEIRTDLLKLSKVCRRPRPQRTNSIGTWKLVMTFIIWFSALTNCLLFGMSSKQLMELLPNDLIEDEDLDLLSGKGTPMAVFIIFGLERIILVLGLVMNLVLESVPDCVKVKLDRAEYVWMKEGIQLRKQRAVSLNVDRAE